MSAITFVEPVSYLILAFAGFMAARRGKLRVFLTEGAFIAAGGMLAELTILNAYQGFYGYSPEWALFVDKMPVTVVLIWGYVISSARELAGYFHAKRSAWLVGAIVLFDAALIESVASRAGMWTWDPGRLAGADVQWGGHGLWGVSWIGWIGWSLYAVAVSYCLDRPKLRWWSPVIATIATHVGLLILWWGALRWVGHDTAPEFLLVEASVFVSLGLTFLATRASLPPLAMLVPRAPAGFIFFAILPLANPTPAFVAFVLPFALPWLVLTWRAWRAVDPAAEVKLAA